jgi:hypothetical protein
MYRRLRRRIPEQARRPAVGLLEVSRDAITARTIHLERPITPNGPAGPNTDDWARKTSDLR